MRSDAAITDQPSDANVQDAGAADGGRDAGLSSDAGRDAGLIVDAVDGGLAQCTGDLGATSVLMTKSGYHSKFWGPGPGDVYVLTGEDSFDIGALIMHLAGGVWTNVVAPHVSAMSGTANEVWFTQAASNTIVHLRSGQISIEQLPITATLYEIWAIAPTDVWAFTDLTALHWNGTEWTTMSLPPLSSTLRGGWRGSWASGPNDVWYVRRWGDTVHWDGMAWSLVGPENEYFRAVSGTSEHDVWLTGRDLWHWDGVVWKRWPVKASDLVDVWARSPTEAWAVGLLDEAYRWDGVDWCIFQHATGGQLTAVWGSDAGELWLAGSKGVFSVQP